MGFFGGVRYFKTHCFDWLHLLLTALIVLSFSRGSFPSSPLLSSLHPRGPVVIIVKYEAIRLCLHEISMSIDLCDCEESFKQWLLFIYLFIADMFYSF